MSRSGLVCQIQGTKDSDQLEYYNLIIMSSGGRREGSGRKRRGKRAIQFKLSPETVSAVNNSVPAGERSALVDQILGEALGVRRPPEIVETGTQAIARPLDKKSRRNQEKN